MLVIVVILLTLICLKVVFGGPIKWLSKAVLALACLAIIGGTAMMLLDPKSPAYKSSPQQAQESDDERDARHDGNVRAGQALIKQIQEKGATEEAQAKQALATAKRRAARVYHSRP
jgi:hypothetical protein